LTRNTTKDAQKPKPIAQEKQPTHVPKREPKHQDV